jgi:hypothetical protein
MCASAVIGFVTIVVSTSRATLTKSQEIFVGLELPKNMEKTVEQLPKGDWRDPITETCYLFYPGVEGVPKEIQDFLAWMQDVLQKRTDGCEIVVRQTPVFPLHEGKQLPCSVTISFWDVAA